VDQVRVRPRGVRTIAIAAIVLAVASLFSACTRVLRPLPHPDWRLFLDAVAAGDLDTAHELFVHPPAIDDEELARHIAELAAHDRDTGVGWARTREHFDRAWSDVIGTTYTGGHSSVFDRHLVHRADGTHIRLQSIGQDPPRPWDIRATVYVVVHYWTTDELPQPVDVLVDGIPATVHFQEGNHNAGFGEIAAGFGRIVTGLFGKRLHEEQYARVDVFKGARTVTVMFDDGSELTATLPLVSLDANGYPTMRASFWPATGKTLGCSRHLVSRHLPDTCPDMARPRPPGSD
jgi:hypothetical protein